MWGVAFGCVLHCGIGNSTIIVGMIVGWFHCQAWCHIGWEKITITPATWSHYFKVFLSTLQDATKHQQMDIVCKSCECLSQQHIHFTANSYVKHLTPIRLFSTLVWSGFNACIISPFLQTVQQAPPHGNKAKNSNRNEIYVLKMTHRY